MEHAHLAGRTQPIDASATANAAAMAAQGSGAIEVSKLVHEQAPGREYWFHASLFREIKYDGFLPRRRELENDAIVIQSAIGSAIQVPGLIQNQGRLRNAS